MSKIEKMHKKARHSPKNGVYCRYHTTIYHKAEECLVSNSIYHSDSIYKCLLNLNICQDFTHIVVKHIMSILISVFCYGYKGKATQFEHSSPCHRTTIAHFLNAGKWNSDSLESTLKARVIKLIYEEAQKSGEPIYCYVDDTISSKTKPSSQALHPIEDAYFHQSHLKRQQDYGHQAVGVMLSCNGLTLCYAIVLYDKSKSKIQIAQDIAAELPVAPHTSYFLCDSWYTCTKIVNAFQEKGFFTIGAIKANRLVSLENGKMQISQLVHSLHLAGISPDLVTVGKRQYFVYRLEVALNGIEQAAILISYPRDAFGVPSALRAFINTDLALSTDAILHFYMERWNIEIFFRQAKQKLALDKYQIRSSQGIKRFWLLMSLAHFICCTGTGNTLSFEDGYSFFQNAIYRERIEYIYRCGMAHLPLKDVLASVA